MCAACSLFRASASLISPRQRCCTTAMRPAAPARSSVPGSRTPTGSPVCRPGTSFTRWVTSRPRHRPRCARRWPMVNGHVALGDQGDSRWLFPGGQPGRPISTFQLAERLRQRGLQPGQARSTALFQLATDLPAAVLAKMLGIHVSASRSPGNAPAAATGPPTPPTSAAGPTNANQNRPPRPSTTTAPIHERTGKWASTCRSEDGCNATRSNSPPSNRSSRRRPTASTRAARSCPMNPSTGPATSSTAATSGSSRSIGCSTSSGTSADPRLRRRQRPCPGLVPRQPRGRRDERVAGP